MAPASSRLMRPDVICAVMLWARRAACAGDAYQTARSTAPWCAACIAQPSTTTRKRANRLGGVATSSQASHAARVLSDAAASVLQGPGNRTDSLVAKRAREWRGDHTRADPM